MGCKQSKAVRIQPVGPASVAHDNTDDVEICDSGTQTKDRIKSGNPDDQYEYDIDDQGNKVRKLRKKKKSRSAKSQDSLNSCDTLGDEQSMESDRGFSAGSKKSADSGLGECDEYSHVITEFSHPDEVQKIEQEFGGEREDLDLMVTGKPCQKRLSAKDKSRLEESMIMQALREEGLITKTKTESTGGVSFEIVAKDHAMRPPPRLAKLEKRRKKKKALTEEEIQEKLERAEKRRKRKEQERLEKIKEIDKSDHLAALDSFAKHQQEKVEQTAQKMDQVIDNRERRMKEIRDKIKAKEKHAEEVRRRKLAQVDTSDNLSGADNPAFDQTV
ncbi:DNA ligase 1-like [Haliotis asinina]|uniref:DNA ligase 1-like n=1 Tax=Haliotis asinina TaxID=109174 RepID=UPI003531CF3E